MFEIPLDDRLRLAQALKVHRAFARLQLGSATFKDIDEPPDYRLFVDSDDTIVRIWAHHEWLYESNGDHERIILQVKKLMLDACPDVLTAIIGAIACSFVSSKHEDMLRFLSRIVANELLPSKLRGLSYYWFCQVHSPNQLPHVGLGEEEDFLSYVDWNIITQFSK